MATSSSAKLEPFLLMAKSAKGVAASKLIENAIAAPGVFVYAELLDVPNVKELASNSQYSSHLTLLQIFSYGTYQDYKQNQSQLPPLNAAQLTKLKQLSIVTLASQSRILPYGQLLTLLDIPSIRALEDLIIDAIYLDAVRGKLDQKHQQFEVQYTMGRDLKPGQLEDLLGALQDWSNRTASVLQALETKISAIDSQDAHAKTVLAEQDTARQATVAELLTQMKTDKSSRRGGEGGNRERPTLPSMEEAMEVDNPALFGNVSGSSFYGAGGSQTRKKPSSSSASNASNTRKRVRGGP